MWQSWTQLLFPLEIDGQFLGRLTLKIIQLKSNQGEEEEDPFSSKMLSNLLDNPHQLIVSHCCPYLVPENWISNKKKRGNHIFPTWISIDGVTKFYSVVYFTDRTIYHDIPPQTKQMSTSRDVSAAVTVIIGRYLLFLPQLLFLFYFSSPLPPSKWNKNTRVWELALSVLYTMEDVVWLLRFYFIFFSLRSRSKKSSPRVLIINSRQSDRV